MFWCRNHSDKDDLGLKNYKLYDDAEVRGKSDSFNVLGLTYTVNLDFNKKLKMFAERNNRMIHRKCLQIVCFYRKY